MKFDGTNWVNVGNAGFSAGGVNFPSLAFNPNDGQLYVAFASEAGSCQANVMKLPPPIGTLNDGFS